MSKTAFMARRRTAQPVRHVTGPSWLVTYKAESLGLFTPSPTQSVKTILAAMGIDITDPDIFVEFVGYAHQ